MRTRILACVNCALVLALAAASPQFRSVANLVVLVDNLALEAIALAALSALLIGGLFDLSMDGVAALSGVIAGELMVAGVNPVWAGLAALSTGALFGWVNGWAVNKWRLNALMVTLATWWIAAGATLGITKALSPYGFPAWFQALGQTRVLGLRVFVLYAAVIVGGWSFMLHKTVTGRHIYAIGGNRRAAELCGVRADRLGIGLYMQAGIIAAFIGLVMAARLNAGAPQVVDGMALRVIAAAVIGGCSLSGGRGSIWAGLLGLVLMAVLSNATVLLHISPYWQKALIGGVLLIAIATERFGRKHVSPSGG